MKRSSIYLRIGRGVAGLFITAMVMASSGILGGCKPTEKNYSEAYDLARNKRERDELRHRELQNDLGVDPGMLQNADALVHMQFGVPDSLGGGTLDIAVRRQMLRRTDSVSYASASVAMFRMGMNARSLAEDLRKEGFPNARAVAGSEESFVIIAEGSEPALLAPEIRRFQREKKDFRYMWQGEIWLILNGR